MKMCNFFLFLPKSLFLFFSEAAEDTVLTCLAEDKSKIYPDLQIPPGS